MKVTVKELKELVAEATGPNKGSKVLLDQEPAPDALDDIRTVNQLVMGIRAKLSKVTDPRALRTIAAVVDAVIADLPSLKQKDQKSGGFAAGVRRALDTQRQNLDRHGVPRRPWHGVDRRH